MKDNWTYKKLGEVSYYPNRRVAVSDLPEYSYVGVENLIKDKGGVSFSGTVPKIDSAIECLKNDILIGNIRPYLRKIWLADRNVGASGDIVVIRINPDFADKLSPNYLYAVLSSDSFFNYDNANTKGAKMPRGDRKVIANFVIPIPSLSEQLHIVSEIKLLQGLISKQQVQLKELDNLAQAVFYDMFGDPVENEKGWEEKSMEELYDIGSSKRVFESQWKTEGVPFIRAREIVRMAKNEPIESPIFVSEELYQDYSKKYGVPSEGDIMITAVGTLGVCYIVKKSDRFYFKDGNILWFKSKGLCETRFIKDQYATDFVVSQIQGNANAAVVGTYTIMNAKKTKVVVPPRSLQKKYVDIVESIDKQKAAISQSIAETQKLFDYTMDKYFG